MQGGKRKPLAGYRMFGNPCAECGLPMKTLWVFTEYLEAWHEGTNTRCQMQYPPPTPIPRAPAAEQKPNKRKLPRRYLQCRHCGTRFMRPRDQIPSTEGQDLCKSCRNQQELFTHDEITELANGLPSQPH